MHGAFAPFVLAEVVLLDWVVIGVYLASILAIGWWAMGKITDAGGFLLAERKLGKLMSMAQTFAGGVNAQDPINIASATYRGGVSGIWVSLQFLLLTPWMWIVAPVGRRTRCVTTLDMIRMRMGRPVEMINFVWGVAISGFGVAVGLKGAVIAVVASSGGSVSEGQAAALIVIPTICYCLMGGILAVCATDVVMSILILALSFMLIPFAIWKLGGVGAMSPPNVPAEHYDILRTSGISWLTVLWFCIGSIPSIGGVNPSGALNEVAARTGTLGLVFKRFCTVGWAAIGIFGVVLFGTYASAGGITTSGIDPDSVFPRVSAELLPDGLRGVMVASVLAAVMSTVAGGMVGFAGNVLTNFYRPFVRPNASASEYLLVARICAAANILMGWFVLSYIKLDMVSFFLSVMYLNAVWGLPLLLCFIWRRVTAYGAVAAAIVMAFVFVHNDIIKYADAPQYYRTAVRWVAGAYSQIGITSVSEKLAKVDAEIVTGRQKIEQSKALMLSQPLTPGPTAAPPANVPAETSENAAKLVRDGTRSLQTARLPIEITQPLYLIPGLLTTILVSLLTPQHNAKSVREFYARLDTPVGQEHLLREKGIQVDLIEDLGGQVVVEKNHGDVQRRLLLLDLLYLPKLIWTRQVTLKDYWLDLVGIGGSIVFIALFIWGLYGLTRIFV